MYVSCGTDTYACEGEPAVAIGLLGLGKIIPSNTVGSSEEPSDGIHSSDGALAWGSDDDWCLWSCNEKTGPTP